MIVYPFVKPTLTVIQRRTTFAAVVTYHSIFYCFRLGLGSRLGLGLRSSLEGWSQGQGLEFRHQCQGSWSPALALLRFRV